MITVIQEYWWLIILATLSVLLVWFYRQTRSYKTLLNQDLQEHGLEYVSEKTPAIFDTGPFREPKGFHLAKTSKVMGIRGEWTTYRIVSYRDGEQKEYEAWVKFRYEFFRLVEMKWNPALSRRPSRKKK